MLYLDYYRAQSSGSSKVERRVVIYKSARAAKRVLHTGSKTLESRRMISEEGVADAVVQKIDAHGFWDVGAHMIEQHFS